MSSLRERERSARKKELKKTVREFERKFQVRATADQKEAMRRAIEAPGSVTAMPGVAVVPGLGHVALPAVSAQPLLRKGVDPNAVREYLAEMGAVATQTHIRLADSGELVPIDPDDMHRETLLARQNMLRAIIDAFSLPQDAVMGLRQQVQEYEDLLLGRPVRILQPVPQRRDDEADDDDKKSGGRRTDSIKDWAARSAFNQLVAREAAARDLSDKDATLALLPRFDKVLYPYRVTVGDIFPGNKISETHDDIATRALGHKAALEGGKGSDTVPAEILALHRKSLQMIEDLQRAGKLEVVSDNILKIVAREMRNSFDVGDYQRMLEKLKPPSGKRKPAK